MCRLPQGLHNNFFGFALDRMSVKFRNILLLFRSRINYTPRPEEFHFKLIFLVSQRRYKTLFFIAQWCPTRKCYYYLNKLDADCRKALHLDYNFTSLKNELSRNSHFLGAFPQARKAPHYLHVILSVCLQIPARLPLKEFR